MHTPFMDKEIKSPHRRDSAGGRLKQRLARILSRSTCTTNATSAAGSGSTGTAFVSLAKTNANANANANNDSSYSHTREPEAPPSPYFCTPCTYERPRVVVGDGGIRPRRRRTRSASLIHISVDCTGGAGGVSGRRSVHSDAPLLQHLLSSVPARDVVNKKQSRGRSKPAARSLPSASRRHCSSPSSSWGRARRPTSGGTPTPYSWSLSSSSTATDDDDDELAPFSGSDEEGGDEAETRTLFSSLSFSSDSTSDFYHTNAAGDGGGNTRTTRRSYRNTTTSHSRRRRAPRRATLSRTSSDPPAPADAFRPVVVSVETKKMKHRECDERNKKQEEKDRLSVGKLMETGAAAAAAAEETAGGEGMAVVKRSSNPYLDFRSSMVEMVVERRIGSVAKMEELLGSYLSLNSPRHHPAILAAFEDVWEAVFGEE